MCAVIQKTQQRIKKSWHVVVERDFKAQPVPPHAILKFKYFKTLKTLIYKKNRKTSKILFMGFVIFYASNQICCCHKKKSRCFIAFIRILRWARLTESQK